MKQHRVHTAGLSKADKRKVWNEIIEDYLNSGRAMNEYSQAHGLNYDHLSYYVRSYKTKQSISPSFIPLQLPLATAQPITITLGDIVIQLPFETSCDAISQIISSLKPLC